MRTSFNYRHVSCVFYIYIWQKKNTSLDFLIALTMPQRIERKKRNSGSLNRKQKSRSGTMFLLISFDRRWNLFFLPVAYFTEQSNTIHIDHTQWVLPETTEYLPTNGHKSNNDDGEESSDQGESTWISFIDQKKRFFSLVDNRQSTKNLP